MKCIRFTPLSTLRSLSTNQNAAEVFSADDDQPSPPHKKKSNTNINAIKKANNANNNAIKKANLPGSRLLAMSSIIPTERKIPQPMMSEMQNYIGDMKYERKKYLQKLSSSKTSMVQNMRPKEDVRAEQAKEDRLGLDKLLEHQIMYPAEKRRKEEKEKQKERTHLPTNVAADVKLLSRLPSLYHISHAIIHEISKRDRGFAPQSMLDVGGSFGASIWAVDKYYSNSMIDYVYYDRNQREQYLGSKLFGKYDNHIPDLTIKGRFSFPRKRGKFDIVSAVNYFSSLRPKEFGIELEKLWERTEGYLVIAENTTGYSAKILEELRHRFCNKLEGGHIFAPCPHMQTCPLVANNTNMTCQTSFMSHLELKGFTPANIVKNNDRHTKTKFSYLVLKRGEKSSVAAPFSRLLSKPNQISTNQIQFQTCNRDGTMSMNDVSKKYASHLWQHLQKRKEGDVISANWVNHPTKFRHTPWMPKVPKHKTKVQQKEDKALRNEEEFDSEWFEEDEDVDIETESGEHGRLEKESGERADVEEDKDSLSKMEMREIFEKYSNMEVEDESDNSEGGAVDGNEMLQHLSDQYKEMFLEDEKCDEFDNFLDDHEDGEMYDDHMEQLDIIEKS